MPLASKSSLLVAGVLFLVILAAALVAPVALSSLDNLNGDRSVADTTPTAASQLDDPASVPVLPGPAVELNQSVSASPTSLKIFVDTTDTPISSSTPPSPATAVRTPTMGSKQDLVIKPPSKYYWGAWIDQVPFDMSKLKAFETVTNRPVDIVHWGLPWMTDGVYQKFPVDQFNQVKLHGSIPLLDWGSWDSMNGIDQPNFRLRDIYQGKHDAFIRDWANAAKAWGHPLFLRFDHEMNGWWFPWSEQLDDNHPGDFVKAWKHVHDLFTEVGATNVTWVWCPNVTGYWRLTPEYSLYPGADYVDWMGMDGFNWGSDLGSYWQTFSQVFRHTYDEFGLMAQDKPIMIPEVASSENGGPLGRPASKAAWIKDAFGKQLPTSFPKVKAVVWFDSNGNNSALTWPLASSQASLDAFLQATGPNFP